MPFTRRSLLQRGVLASAGLRAALIKHGPAAARNTPPSTTIPDEDGYELWLRYRKEPDPSLLQHYRSSARAIRVADDSDVTESIRAELSRALTAITDGHIAIEPRSLTDGTILVGTPTTSHHVRTAISASEFSGLGSDGFLIRSATVEGHSVTVIAANEPKGLLYGSFALIRHMQMHRRLDGLIISDAPRCSHRIVNHWDALDRTVERGYAGLSIFHWDDLAKPNARYEDYARMLASVGINGTVINNVNASPKFLASDMLPGYRALATVLRRWGIRLFLSANFACPMKFPNATGKKLSTADPFDPDVQRWWSDKIGEIYSAIPDFGGFLVKANSEGEPGPLAYGRTHADGANMFARLLKPHGGVVMWRSFVHTDYKDWSELAYRTFHPLDGEFDDNVMLQTKNGTIDFMVREAYNPLLGAMPRTNQMLELQITQEYTGHSTHLCYLPVEWNDVLSFDTRYNGEGPTIADVVDGTAYGQPLTGIAGVINVGDDRNWTGSYLAAANTHGFGRLAWDHTLDPADLANEWATLTFGPDPVVVKTIVDMLMPSWRTYEKYTTPFGVGYMMRPYGAHYEPDPVHTENVEQHTDKNGSGFDRTLATGTGFTRLHSDYWFQQYEQLETCPEQYLMFMHIVPWDHRLRSGTTVIQQIYDDHIAGVKEVEANIARWKQLENRVDHKRFASITSQLGKQEFQARTWRDVMLDYYFSRSQRLSEREQWLQIEVERNPHLLLGGVRNEVTLNVANATSHAQTFDLAADSSLQGWASIPEHVELAPKETRKITINVQPPLEPSYGPFPLARPSSPALTVGFDTQLAIVTPHASFCAIALDIGSTQKESVSGYRSLLGGDIWDGSREAGWVNKGPADSHLATGWTKLQNNCASASSPRTLRLRVPAGKHKAWTLIGGEGWGTQPVSITHGHTVLVRSSYLDEGEFQWFGCVLDGGSKGQTIDLVISGADGRTWRLAALTLMHEVIA